MTHKPTLPPPKLKVTPLVDVQVQCKGEWLVSVRVGKYLSQWLHVLLSGRELKVICQHTWEISRHIYHTTFVHNVIKSWENNLI